ncbi:MAG: hypothetical protein QN122_13035 [Armatimonadota bacterium]|nr:hypothetical protein [Armatimonadota bacterium]MDR7528903.1 hypothetical protein [Armatimonadota bacterium]
MVFPSKAIAAEMEVGGSPLVARRLEIEDSGWWTRWGPLGTRRPAA